MIVDETSMVSLSQMARLVEAVHGWTRGSSWSAIPIRLSSIEAGAVLGDIVGDGAGDGVALGTSTATAWASEPAAAIRDGDPDRTIEVLGGGAGGREVAEARRRRG